MELNRELLGSLTEFEDAVTEIEQHLQPLLKSTLSEVCEQLSNVENAKLYSGIAYTLNTLFFMYLRSVGTSPTNHPVRKELDRVKQSIQKITEASKKPEINPMKVDKAAASRFILHKLSCQLDNEQKHQLHQKSRNTDADNNSDSVPPVTTPAPQTISLPRPPLTSTLSDSLSPSPVPRLSTSEVFDIQFDKKQGSKRIKDVESVFHPSPNKSAKKKNKV